MPKHCTLPSSTFSFHTLKAFVLAGAMFEIAAVSRCRVEWDSVHSHCSCMYPLLPFTHL